MSVAAFVSDSPAPARNPSSSPSGSPSPSVSGIDGSVFPCAWCANAAACDKYSSYPFSTRRSVVSSAFPIPSSSQSPSDASSVAARSRNTTVAVRSARFVDRLKFVFAARSAHAVASIRYTPASRTVQIHRHVFPFPVSSIPANAASPASAPPARNATATFVTAASVCTTIAVCRSAAFVRASAVSSIAITTFTPSLSTSSGSVIWHAGAMGPFVRNQFVAETVTGIPSIVRVAVASIPYRPSASPSYTFGIRNDSVCSVE